MINNDLLSIITSLTDYLGLTISTWLAFYLLSRGQGNKASLRIFMGLGGMALYYYNAFQSTIDPSAGNEPFREFAIIIALIAWHQLTFLFLPLAKQRKLEWTTYIPLVLGGVAAAILFATHEPSGLDPRFTYPIELNSGYLLVGILQLLIALASVYNLAVIYRSKSWPESKSFFAALALALTLVAYGLVGTIFHIPLPRFISTITLLITFVLLSYSVAKHQSLVERRISLEDLPASAVLIFGLTAVYVLILRSRGLSAGEIALLSVLVISSHSIYDLVYGFIDRLFHRRERAALGEVRALARGASANSLKRNLRRGLTILCRNLQASGGFIALRQGGVYSVAASIGSFAPHSELAAKELEFEKPVRPEGRLAEKVVWLAPAFAGREQVGVVGIGPRLGNKEYSEADLFWMEDFSDQVGTLIFAQRKPSGAKGAKSSDAAGEDMLTALAFQPDAKLVKVVEDGLRNLNDYVRLGASPLVRMVAVGGKTNIERGKQLHEKIIEILNTLSPHGKMPAEPLPREWHSYAILHDAYVDEVPDRDIMGKLYISEGTFYRARRKALHGVAKAILEMEGTN